MEDKDIQNSGKEGRSSDPVISTLLNSELFAIGDAPVSPVSLLDDDDSMKEKEKVNFNREDKHDERKLELQEKNKEE